MKLVVRAFVLGLFAVGASAAVINVHSTSHMTTASVSQQQMSPTIVTPTCSPSQCPSTPATH